MDRKAFLKSGHFPTLISALLYFDVSFMVWVLLGPLAPFISEQLHLTPAQKGLLTAIPLLGGSLFRPVMAALADRIGGRRAGLFGMAVTLVPLALGWHFANQLWHFYCAGFLLGVAGASFGVALPMASRWYPPEQQGLVMGIAGAGNSGTLMATLFAPRLAQHYGYHAAFAFAALPVLAVMVIFTLCAKDNPTRKVAASGADYARLFRESDTYWMSFFYSLTFGGFVGLTSYLTLFFADQYHLSKVRAGDFTTLVVIAGSLLRPVGGWLADKLGGYRFLLLLLACASAAFAAMSTLPPLAAGTVVLFLAMAALGMGNGAVFQLVPLRFSTQVGIMTGIVGAAGGLGGFFIPFGLGYLKGRTGHYNTGFAVYSAIFLIACSALLALGRRWVRTWPAEQARYAAIFAFGNPLGGRTDAVGAEAD
jgi:MFS transporter, NNP family, nitrate/nitrite transporter